jgi:hypothetical protein
MTGIPSEDGNAERMQKYRKKREIQREDVNTHRWCRESGRWEYREKIIINREAVNTEKRETEGIQRVCDNVEAGIQRACENLEGRKEHREFVTLKKEGRNTEIM